MKLHEIVMDQPFIWSLVAKLKDRGKRFLFHAHVPGSSAYVIGSVESVHPDRCILWVFGERKRLHVSFSADDDKNLTMRPSNSPDVYDYTIIDA
jgi:hypothetical protein